MLGVNGAIAGNVREKMRVSYKSFDLRIIPSTEGSEINLDELDFDEVVLNTYIPLYETIGYFRDENDDWISHVRVMGSSLDILSEQKLFTIKEQISEFVMDSTNYTVISEYASAHYELNLNDEMKIRAETGERILKVGAIAENDGIFFNSESGFMILLLGESLGKEMTDNKVSSVLADIDNDKMNINDSVKAIEAKNDFVKAIALIDEEELNWRTSNIDQLLLMLLLIVVMISLFVIHSFNNLILSARIPVVGTFRSIGASRGTVNRILIIENIIYGVLGGALGIAVAGIFEPIFYSLLYRVYFPGTTGISIRNIVIALLFSTGFQIVVSLFTILRTSRIEIIRTIFNTANTRANVSKKQTIAGIACIVTSFLLVLFDSGYSLLNTAIAFIVSVIGFAFMVPGITKIFILALNRAVGKIFGNLASLGIKNLTINKSTSSNTTLISITLAAVVAILIISNSLNGFFGRALELGYGEMFIEGFSKSYKDYEYLEEVEGVAEANYVFAYIGPADLNDQSFNRFVFFGSDEPELTVIDKDNRIPYLGDDEVVLDEFFANKYGFEIGDEIAFGLNEHWEPTVFRIVGYVDASMTSPHRRVAVASLNAYKEHFTDVPVRIDIHIEEDADIERVYQNIRNAIAKDMLGVVIYDEFIQSQKDDTDGVFMLINMIIALAGILVAIGIINNMVIAFLQRQKEFAVLYSIAMSKGQLRKMLIFEVFGMLAVGCLCGGLLGIWLHSILLQLLHYMELNLESVISVSQILGIVGIAFLVFSLTTMIPLIRISRLKVVEQLKI
jgi:ABC-type antimicrobial peptide transport system permease subunit